MLELMELAEVSHSLIPVKNALTIQAKTTTTTKTNMNKIPSLLCK